MDGAAIGSVRPAGHLRAGLSNLVIAALVGTCLLWAVPSAAQAATTFTLTSNADAGTGTLRADLEAASAGDTMLIEAPANEFSIGKLNNNRKKGTAVSPVLVPGPGTLTAEEARDKGLIRPTTLYPAAAEKVLVPLVPTAAGRKVLKRKGRFQEKVRVTFTPTGGSPASQVFSPVLKLDRPKGR